MAGDNAPCAIHNLRKHGCSSRFRKDGGKAWYAVLKTSSDDGEPYWGREYVEVD